MSEAKQPRKILLVDDSETILTLERMILRNAYQLMTAKDGREGVAQALALRPDLILLDVMMPNMNGFEALRELRRRPATRAIPVVMVTTRGEEESMETAFSSGCNDYIMKPIDGQELLTKVRSFLPV
jgi:PleD family two-component response regulator